MSNPGRVTSDDLVARVERIMQIDFATEADHNAAIIRLQSLVADPRVSDYIYYWHNHFDHEPTPAEIVQRALDYRPIALGGPTEPDLPPAPE